MKNNRLLKYLCSTISPALLLSTNPAQAATINFSFDTLFSDGAVPPVGPSPWLTLTTTDTGLNEVMLAFKAASSMGDANVISLYLNVNPALDLSRLTFSTSTTLDGAFTFPSISMSENAYKADGDGYYDILLQFATSNAGAGQRFTAGDEMSYILHYTPPIGGGSFDAQSFNSESFSDHHSENGPFLAAAHVGTTGNNGTGSAWLAAPGSVLIAPEPSASLYGLLALALCLKRRRPSA